MCVFSFNWLRMTKVLRCTTELPPGNRQKCKDKFFLSKYCLGLLLFHQCRAADENPNCHCELAWVTYGLAKPLISFVNGESLHVGCQTLKTTSNLSPNYYIDLFFGTCLLSFDVLCLVCGNCYSICILLPAILSREVLNSNWIFLIK